MNAYLRRAIIGLLAGAAIYGLLGLQLPAEALPQQLVVLALTYLVLGACYYYHVEGTIVLMVILVAIGIYGLTLAPVTWVMVTRAAASSGSMSRSASLRTPEGISSALRSSTVVTS